MTLHVLDRLGVLVAEAAGAVAFSASLTTAVSDLQLEVRGVGPIDLPVSQEQAQQLCLLGREARYGRGEQTVVDRLVRDTWEVPKSRVKIDQRQWNKTLLPVLDGVRADLGLAPGCRLKAELHSMLVYSPGQFFAPHQDSEKVDAMVGSLVVTLPTSTSGGVLIVEHAGRRSTYRPSKTALSFVAFYADCLHEVRPTRSGYRVALTYNLLLRGEARAEAVFEAGPGVVEALARHLDEHFSTPAPSRYRQVASPPADPPSRLLYLLDHEYTASGLHWARLKGDDARRAELLLMAADRADCDVVLALADVHETWSCSEAEWDGRRGARGWVGRRWHQDDDIDEEWSEDDPNDTDDPDRYELEEMIDGSTKLEWWIAPSADRAEPVSTSVDATEVCAATPSTDLRPDSSEYEGYMGNYGNTMDRWYRRAAVVLWPRRLAFVVRAEASPGWAIDELSRRIRTGDAAGAQENAATLAPFWASSVGAEPQRGFTAKALRLAHTLDEPALATMLLKPLGVEALAPGQAPALVALVERYGEPWARDLLVEWSGHARPWAPTAGGGRAEWIVSLVRLCESLEDGDGTGTATARLLVEDSWAWLGDRIGTTCGFLPPSRRDQALAQLARPVTAVLESTAVIGAADLQEAVAEFLCGENDGLLPLSMHALRAAAKPPPRHRAAALDTLAPRCASRLEARLALPQRAADDWSIQLPEGCRCELCAVLVDFLSDRARRTFEWPLAQERRRHVHSRLDGAELPVRHQTRRTGRPYTLVLTKTEALFERETQARRQYEADLAWLYEHHSSASSPDARRRRSGGGATEDSPWTDAARR